jgi:hypothetical protein
MVQKREIIESELGGGIPNQGQQPAAIGARGGLRRDTVDQPLQLSAPTARRNLRKRHLSDPASRALPGRVTNR